MLSDYSLIVISEMFTNEHKTDKEHTFRYSGSMVACETDNTEFESRSFLSVLIYHYVNMSRHS